MKIVLPYFTLCVNKICCLYFVWFHLITLDIGFKVPRNRVVFSLPEGLELHINTIFARRAVYFTWRYYIRQSNVRDETSRLR